MSTIDVRRKEIETVSQQLGMDAAFELLAHLPASDDFPETAIRFVTALLRYRNAEHAEAEKMLLEIAPEELASLNPDWVSERLLLLSGTRYFQGDYERSIAYAREAEQLAPDAANVHVMRVQAEDMLHPERTEAAYRELAERFPGDPYPLLALGEYMNRTDRYPEAYTYAKQVLEKDAQDQHGLEIAAKSLFMQQQYLEAIGYARQIVANRPFNCFAYVLICESEMALRQFSQAIDDFHEGLHHCPENGMLHYRLAVAMLQVSSTRPEQIVEHAMKGVELLPGDTMALFVLAHALANNGNWQLVKETIEEIKRYPNLPPGLGALEEELATHL